MGPVSFIKNKKGQTSVEYLLMLVVVVAMMTTVLKQLKGYLLADDGDCTGTTAKTSLMCQVKKIWSPDESFRKFKLPGA